MTALGVLGLQTQLFAQCDGVATFTDARDSRVYNMVQIDGGTTPYCTASSQCWMAQNLDHGTMVTGGNGNQTNNGVIEKFCYANNAANCTNFGGLYNWDEVMAYGITVGGNGPGPQGICPAGWHVPTDNEWKCMEMNLGMSQANADATGIGTRGTDEAGRLKETGLTRWNAGNVGATNATGFTAEGAGYWNAASSTFKNIRNVSNPWSSTEDVTLTNTSWMRGWRFDNAQVVRDITGKVQGHPLRCVRDNAPTPLPVKLLFFKANWTDESYETATLEWETASEWNNSHFEIERSIDGVNFQYVASVSGQGTSSVNTNYSAIDKEPYSENVSYYRLKQVDFNGDYEYSNIEALNLPQGINVINLFPNPAIDDLNVLVTSSEEIEVVLSIKNNLGQEVFNRNSHLSKGMNTLKMEIPNLSVGNYTVEISATNGIGTVERKFIKREN